MTNWIEEVILNKNILHNFRWLLIFVILVFGVWVEKTFAMERPYAPDSPFSFPVTDRNIVTMDIEKTNGGGGTLKCPSVQACYIYVLKQEARGALQYCESMTIKKNGVIVWKRKYW